MEGCRLVVAVVTVREANKGFKLVRYCNGDKANSNSVFFDDMLCPDGRSDVPSRGLECVVYGNGINDTC